MLLNRTDNLYSKPAGAFTGLVPRNRGGVGASAPRHAAEVRPVLSKIQSFTNQFLTLLFILILLPTQAHSANIQFVNRAELHSAELLPMVSTVSVSVVSRTPSTTEFLKYAPGVTGTVNTNVHTTFYKNAAGAFAEVNPPVAAGSGSVIDLSSPLPLLKTSLYHAGEPLLVRLTDHDQNIDKTVAETVLVTVSDAKTGDIEVLRLTETGSDTGVFVGYIQTVSASTAAAMQSLSTGITYNGIFTVSEASSITAHYVDIVDGSDSSADAATVDPFGLVFDSMTGKPVDGAKVELLNADGSAAKVLGDNGAPANSYPNVVISGSTAKDHDNNTYSFTPGGYRFPFVTPGNYIVKITPPPNYSAPSKTATAAIQALPGAPFTILEPGSRGEVFAVTAGPAIRIDIPLDPKSGTLWLSKTADKNIVSAGEHLSYDITLENSDPLGTVFSPVISDKLPQGFRYEKGTTRINGKPASDPAVSADGTTLTFTLANIPPATSVKLHYLVAVGAGAVTGDAVNAAFATGSSPAFKSNIAKATVKVQEPFMQSRNIIMGRVIVGACSENSDDNKKGMGGIGIYLEDGTFVISDKFGMFHFEGVRSGTHVVQLDLDSVPEGYKILPCEQNSRFAGRAYSQFVDMQGGTMWRTDFYLGKVELTSPVPLSATETNSSVGKEAEAAISSSLLAGYKGEITLEMISSQNDDVIDYRLPLHAHTVPLNKLKLTVKLPEAASYIPGSSTFNGATLPDPEISGSTLLYPLEDANEKWLRELQFRAKVNKQSKTGELETKAVLKFSSETSKDVTTPEVSNILSITREEKIVPLPIFVFRPHFPTFGAELSDIDRLELDGLVDRLSGKIVQRIDVTGHTDSVRIAPRSRGIHADNSALSLARAKSIGHYLAASLHLPPSALFLNGSADKEPVATNKTADGRALNRRVEVKISAVERVETTYLKIVKERSGIEKTETTGAPVKLNEVQPDELKPLQLKNESIIMPPVSNPTEAFIQADKQPAADPSQKSIVNEKNAQKKGSALPIVKDEERVELISALQEGIVHYRLRLIGMKQPLDNVTATIVTPKNFLYMAGTSRLPESSVPDPTAIESVISYKFDALKDETKFDLRLQAIIDGDDQKESLSSSVTVVIADRDSKPLKTFIAASELSDSMEEINRPAAISVAEARKAQEIITRKDEKEKSEAEINEFMEIVPAKAGRTNIDSVNGSTSLHIDEQEGIHSPADGTVLASPINAVRIVLSSALTPQLLLDGKEIPANRIGFSMKDPNTNKSLYSYIGVDFGEPGDHTLQLKGLDSFGIARFDKKASITRAGEIYAIRLVSADGNIADNRTPVQIRVQLLDRDGKPINAYAQLSVKGGMLKPLSPSGSSTLGTDANCVAVASDGWISFQPVTSSGLYKTQLAFNKATLDIETYVKPKMRDWILVGLAEGTVGYNTVSGHMNNLKVSGQEDNLYDKERLALYAKGTIKGEWLLTMAYDSAKHNTGVGNNGLFQTIDPNSFYTIYGDGTSQLYDTASQKKLYLKIERDQFYAMFGDYDTGLTVSELSRYSRRMNGFKSEFRSTDNELTTFASETAQAFAKDELRGDGTSGLYRLSKKGLVLNSEKITIESRDRFHSEVVTESKQMSRFIDYSIDYDNGTIFFKSPVPNRDDKLNPVYIMVDYEVTNAGKDALTYGGHASTRLMNGKLQVGGTYVHEGHVNGENNLYGVDTSIQLAPGTKARAEFATTTSDMGTTKTNGNAYLAEITHSDKQLDGKLYYREQEDGFGLGQQKGSEAGTRKFGAESGYKLTDSVTLSSQAYRQYTLTTGAVRDFIETLASYNEKQYSLRTGLRYASDSLPDGSNETSILATAGGSWKTADQKITLRADHDQALFSKNLNTDFPTRTIFGADYQATKATMLFAQEELTYGAAANTNTTRIGAKSTPWSGGTLNSAVVNDMRENSDRTFANVGLTQKWQISPLWAVDGGLDHSQTIRKKAGYTLNANVPPASGGEDFTAVSLGANYTEKKLMWSNRIEYRNSNTDDKWGIISGLVNEQGLNWGWTARLQLLHTQAVGGNTNTSGDLRFGLAYRPPVTKWIILDRLDLIALDEKNSTTSSQGQRIVNNLNANFRPDKKTQVSIQYGAKYVFEQIDEKNYSGYTDLVGIEGRYDINKEWDLGLRTSVLHSWAVGQYGYSFGPSIGYNVVENAWISLGYNIIGFQDRDFSAADYTAQGPFVQFRFKFDQNSVKEGLKMLGQ